MITAIFTNARLVVFGHGTPKGTIELVNAELAGRSFPMTSTFHVFHNTIINRYKDALSGVFYPIALNVVFPTTAYFDTSQRKHFLKYLLDREDLFRIRQRKSLMEATIDGWTRKNKLQNDRWIALDAEDSTSIGVKENVSFPLKIKNDPNIGQNQLLVALQEFSRQHSSIQDAALLTKVDHINAEQTAAIFNTNRLELKFPEDQEVPNNVIEVSEKFRKSALKNTTNRIFLHINNLYSKLYNGMPIFMLGSFLNSPSILDTLRKDGLKYDYQVVFLSEEEMPRLAAESFSHIKPAQKLSSQERTLKSAGATGTTAIDIEAQQETSSQSQTLNQSTEIKAEAVSMEAATKALISDQFVIEYRFPNQEFLFFRGYQKSKGIKRLYRFISHEDYKSKDRKAAFIKLYKKEKKLYPKLSTLVHSKAGMFYYLNHFEAKPLRQVIAQTRMKRARDGVFKSEDVQLFRDIYQKLETLPVTFSNLTLDSIYVRQKSWWRASSTNEIYFLGIDTKESTKAEMTQKLNDLIIQNVHPTIIDHINNN